MENSRQRFCALLVLCWLSGQLSGQVPLDPDANAPSNANSPLIVPVQGPNANGMQGGVAPGSPQSGQGQSLKSDARVSKLFGEVTQVGDLPAARRANATAPAVDAIFSAEATGRKTADVGDLLNQSKASHGVTIQHRTPITSDTRIRGQRVGQVLASGSFWAPARMDLDTMMNKIDSRLIENAILIKGPYATRYGPGFRFVDLEFIKSPRYSSGPEVHGLSGVTYNTNGKNVHARQSFWGGAEDYGFHLSYGHQTGNDYETGAGFLLPTSYKSRDLFLAFGKDLSSYESIEINALRLDQTDVEFPGLVFDLNLLVTDGYEITYHNEAPMIGDLFTAEVWYNRSRFYGDTLRLGKNNQIPTLIFDLESPSGFDGFAITDGDALSGGYRVASTLLGTNRFGGDRRFTVGTDLIILNQELNDIEPLAPATDNNFPIPRSHSIGVGIFAENIDNVTDRLTITSGARIDGVFTDARDDVTGVPIPMSVLKFSELDQEFILGGAFVSGEYKLPSGWILDLGLGTSQRPPTLTELYADNSFIGSLQRGLTFLEGDPQLKTEKLFQVDAGIHMDREFMSFGLFGHHSWIHDFITYDLVSPAGGIDGFPQGAALVNTDLATLSGCEVYGQFEANEMFSFFGNMNYVEGRDHSRNEAARLFAGTGRSGIVRAEEPLPGIAPMESRVGFVIQDPNPQRNWGIEFLARIVNSQERIASSLEEVRTGGFTTYNLRTYARYNRWLFTAGVENMTNKHYQEHIDYRSGLGVFRPGISFYSGAQVNY